MGWGEPNGGLCFVFPLCIENILRNFIIYSMKKFTGLLVLSRRENAGIEPANSVPGAQKKYPMMMIDRWSSSSDALVYGWLVHRCRFSCSFSGGGGRCRLMASCISAESVNRIAANSTIHIYIYIYMLGTFFGDITNLLSGIYSPCGWSTLKLSCRTHPF